MIVRERADGFVLIAQHDHARLSGWLAAAWGSPHVPAPPSPRAPLVLAASLHDVAWLALDDAPAWNPDAGRPYSFVDLPVEHKLEPYRRGIDLVEAADPYAAYLCSLHYASFFPPDAAPAGSAAAAFVAGERRRRARLARGLRAAGRAGELARARYDLQLLKLWDHLSLYACMNEPGVAKEEEHPWYRDGLPPVTVLDPGGGRRRLRLHARWLDGSRIGLWPFPLAEPGAFPLPYRWVSRAEVAARGLAEAYRRAPVRLQPIAFVPDPGGGTR